MHPFGPTLGASAAPYGDLTAGQLAESSVGPQIARVLHRVHVYPRRLVLEVTESLVMDDGEAAAATLWQLRALGIRIFVDDFGTGYSSLSRLVDLPLDDSKIDRSFVRELSVSDAGATIVQAAIAMADGLNLTVVAEGVESPVAAGAPRTHRVQSGAGLPFSRPLPADNVGETLRRGPHVHHRLTDDDAVPTPEHLRQTRPIPTIIPRRHRRDHVQRSLAGWRCRKARGALGRSWCLFGTHFGRYRPSVVDRALLTWLLDSDPSLRWQVERDLAGEPQEVWPRTRAHVAVEGFGAQLLSCQDEDGQWAGGAYFPADATQTEPGQP